MSPSQAASFSKQLDRGCQQSAALWWHCFQQDALVPARGDPAATCRPHGCCTLSSNLTETHREELRPRESDQKESLTDLAGAGRCHGGAGAALAAVGAPVETTPAELAVLPLRVALAVQAAAWGQSTAASWRQNWSRTFGA